MLVRLAQQRDQMGAQIRDEYLRLDENKRDVFRRWVDRLVQAGEAPMYETGTSVAIRVHLQVPGQGEMETVAISPHILARAIAAWDEGEEYLPSAADF
jgi:hypothetical protein